MGKIFSLSPLKSLRHKLHLLVTFGVIAALSLSGLTYLALQKASAYNGYEFVTRWENLPAGELEIAINDIWYNSGINNRFLVKWGDGTPQEEYGIPHHPADKISHRYATAGTYEISIHVEEYYGDRHFAGWNLKDNPKAKYLTKVVQWGQFKFYDMSHMFDGAINLADSPHNETPNTSEVVDMSYMFNNAAKFNGNVSGFNTSKVRDMKYMFNGATRFDQDVSKFSFASLHLNHNSEGDYSRLDHFVDKTNLSRENYDRLLASWRGSLLYGTLQRPVSDGLKYCISEPDRNHLVANGWDLSGDRLDCSGLNLSPFITEWKEVPETLSLKLNGSKKDNYFRINWGDGTIEDLINVNQISHTYRPPHIGQTKRIRIYTDAAFSPGRKFSGWNLDNNPAASKLTRVVSWGNVAFTDMSYMFADAANLEHFPPQSPNTANVENMASMFSGATKFNQPVNFDTSNVTRMSFMFAGAEAFNQPVNFNTSKVIYMDNMFLSASSFDQPINFDTAQTETLSSMFYGATKFNSPIHFTDTSKVNSMSSLFQEATSFNQPINFNTSNTRTMARTFYKASSFNQDISQFDFSSAIASMDSYSLTDFVSHSKLSVKNYDKLLKKWREQYQDGTETRSPNSTGLKYCAAVEHSFLKNTKHWTFSDTKDSNCNEKPFTTRWTDLPAGSLYIRLHGSDNTFDIDWGDGIVETKTNVNSISHVYANAGTYNLKINVGDGQKFNGWSLSKNNRAKNLTHVVEWGDVAFTNMKEMFYTASELISFPSSKPNTENVTDMSYMFVNAKKFNQPVEFDTSSVTKMRAMFANAHAFNQPVNFNTSKVTDMAAMFQYAKKFNQPINFDTANVNNMESMFSYTEEFNGAISFTDTSKVINMNNMFNSATAFNQDLSSLDFAAVETLGSFVSRSKLSVKNYDKLLKKWHAQFKDNTSVVHKPYSNGLKYCTAETEHDYLKNTRNWEFNDSKDCPARPFITRWTDLPAGEFTLNLHGNDNTFKIDWGDGIVENKTNVNIASHLYADAGTREIKIYTSEAGQKFNGWGQIANSKIKRLTAVLDWGDIKFTNMSRMFSIAEKLNSLPNTAPDTSSVTDMSFMFSSATAFNQPVNFDTSNVTDMSGMFYGAKAFNQPVNFDTSKVFSMRYMFNEAWVFNQPVNFDTSNVVDANSMFNDARAFNQPVNFDTSKVTMMSNMFSGTWTFNKPVNFNTSNVVDMSGMFYGATAFNQPVNFDTSKVTNMNHMFYNAKAFNQPVNFDTSNVTDMSYMFTNTTDFNQPVNFDTSKVTNMSAMFTGTWTFNKPVNFDTSNVTDMSYMFYGAKAFNQPVNFDTSKVTHMNAMFHSAQTFNEPVNFNTSNVVDMRAMFYGATAFNQDLASLDFAAAQTIENFVSNSKLSAKNYDKLLKKWYTQFKDKPIVHRPKSDNLTYCSAKTEHDYLKNTKNWTLNDNKDCSSLNFAPADITLSTNQVNENNAPNFELADITITNDPNDIPGDTNTPSLTCETAGPDDSSFQITGNKLILKPSANFEAKNQYKLCIRATDAGGKTKDKNFTIEVKDINEKPVIENQIFNIAENSANDTEIDQVVASDPDNGQSLTYSIVSGNDLDIFEITNSGKLKVKDNTHLDYEQHQSVTLKIRATDNGTPALHSEADITINITDVNEAPSIANQTLSVAENSANGTEVGQVAATDPEHQNLDYKITGGNDLGIFEIGANGKLKVKDSTNLDHEQHPTITLRVKVADSGTPILSAEADITVNITDVNEAPVWTSTDQLTINEDATTEHTLAATDPENNSLTYSAENLPGWITLENGKLTLKPTQAEVGNHEIKLKVSDGTNEIKQTLKITVKNVNDAPVWTSSSAITMNEKETLVHALTATDEDGDSLTYSAANLPDWITFSDNKLTLKPKKSEIGTHTLTVNVSDGTTTVSQTITVNVKNVNDAPVVTSEALTTAIKGKPYSYTITATDEDGDPLTYSVTKKPDWLSFDPATQTLSGTPGNNEADKDYEITLTVSDGIATTTQTFTLHVSDKNYAPTISDQTFSVAENSTNGTEIGQIAATDPDAGQTLTYSIASGNDLGIFEITNDGKLKVKDNANLDFEKHQSITLKVKVTDNGSPVLSAKANITINITDVNEKPVVKNQTFSVAENTANGTEIGQVTATDPDADQTLVYSIVSGNDLDIFEITTDGKIKVKDNTNLDHEKHPTVTLHIKATDNGTPALHSEADITVNITDVNEAPVWTSTDQLTINEDATTEHTLAATDPENNSLTYSAENLPNWIKLTNNKLTLNPTQTEVGNHEIKLKVSDGTNETKQTLKITVKNVNDAPVITSNALKSATEDQPYSYIITATDEDGDSLTYSATKKPDWLNFDPATQTLSGTPGSSEADKDYEITLAVSDGTATTTQTFTLHVNKINHAPNIADQTFTIAENSANGTEVAQIVATDPDNNQTLNYQILNGNDLNIFEITNDGKLKVKDNTNLDYEKHQSVTLRVKVTDNGTPALSAEADIAINITDVDDEAPTITVNKDPITLTVGDTFTAPEATCHDNQSSCTLTVENNVDTTTAGSYHITYTATDEAGNKTIVTVPVTIKAKTTPTPPTPSNPSGSNQNQNQNQNSNQNQTTNPSPSISGALSFNPNLNRRSNYRYFNNQFSSQISQNNQTDQNHDNDATSSTHGKNKSKNKTAIFSLKGKAKIELRQGQNYVEPGVKCNDSNSCTVSITGKVNKDLPGTYVITYKGSANGKTKTLTRKVIVKSADQTKDSKDSNIFNWWWLLIPTTVVLYGTYRYRRQKQQKSS